MEQTFKWFSSFIELKRSLISAQPVSTLMKHNAFRKFLLEKEGKTLKIVKLMAPHMVPAIVKPQRLLVDDDEYYIAQDTLTNTFYICYRRLVMCDVDLDSEEAKNDYLDWLRHQCEMNPEWKFAVFKTRKGFHVFPLHTLYDDRDAGIEMQLRLRTDFYYTVFTYLRGSSVRLNPKKGDIAPIYEFCGLFGVGEVNEEADQLVRLHFVLQFQFQNVGVSKMK